MAKLQDVETTTRWHNIWLGSTIFFFATTAVFAGLFVGYHSAWSRRAPCEEGVRWVHGTGPKFADACHMVGDDGLYAIEGKACPSDCDAWWYANHPKKNVDGRRLTATNEEGTAQMASIVNCKFNSVNCETPGDE